MRSFQLFKLALLAFGMILVSWFEKVFCKSMITPLTTKSPSSPGKMMNEFSVCNACANPIFNRGSILKVVYLETCALYCQEKRPFVCSILDHLMTEPVKFLEKRGFVISTELSKSYLGVKPINYHLIEDLGPLYCSALKEHFPNFVESNCE